MSCESGFCGTGDFPGPKPGDPSNSVSLSANVVFGGINVSWSWPTLNSHAVAHTILYRGITPVFANAIQLAIVAGSIFYDQIDIPVPITYYYWIEIVSVNGTVGATIGPASTTSKPRALATLESLTGQIDESVLAQALKTTIGGITMVNGRVSTEIQDRINANAALLNALNQVQSGSEQAMTFVQEEITQRTEGDNALLTSLTTLSTAVGQNFSLFQNEQILRSGKDSGYAGDFTLLFTKVGQNAAAVQEESKARVDADGALASRMTTTEVAVNGNVATGQIGLSSKIVVLDGKVVEIGSLYTAKVSVNGLIGGFGVHNDGRLVDAGFDVDRFWVGRTGPDRVKPFIIDSGIVYIDKARIRNADIDTLKIAGESITVPRFTNASYPTGSGNILTIGLYVPHPATYICVASMKQSYTNQTGQSWLAQLTCNGSTLFSTSGDAVADSLSLCGGVYLSAGYHTFNLYWTGTSGITAQDRSMFVMAAMK